MINLIVAHSQNYVIGDKGTIPWHISDDLKRFKALTTGHAIIMGRKTYDSLGRPLPNRTNIVITRNKNYKAEGAVVVDSLKNAIKAAGSDDEIFIIGGGEIYKQAMEIADRVYATIIDKEIPGDTHFVRLNLGGWKLADLEKKHDDKEDLDYYYATYTRRETPPKLYYIDAGRTLEQIFQMEDLEDRGVCVFCEEHFKKEHGEPIDIETKHWLVTKNDYPYPHTKLHLLYVPKKHANKLSDLESSALDELPEVMLQIEKKYKLTSYGQFMRVGEFYYNGASIHHLHGHIIVGDHEHPEFESLKVKLGSKPKA